MWSSGQIWNSCFTTGTSELMIVATSFVHWASFRSLANYDSSAVSEGTPYLQRSTDSKTSMHIIAAQTSIQLKLLFLTAFSIFHIQFKYDFTFIFLQSDIQKAGSTVGYTLKQNLTRWKIKFWFQKMFLISETTVIPIQQQHSEQVKKKKKALTIQTRIYLICPRFERCYSRTGGGRDRKDRRRKSKP